MVHLSHNITLVEGLLGGVIIGTSSVLFMYFNGRITGISGICETAVTKHTEFWSIYYMLGLFLSGFLLSYIDPEFSGETIPLSVTTIVTAGVLTGFGTRLSGGCTSGHGLCGLSRFSPRSLTAVLSFMASGALTAYISRHPSVYPYLIDNNSHILEIIDNHKLAYFLPAMCVVGLAKYIYSRTLTDIKAEEKRDDNKQHSWSTSLSSFFASTLFGLGLGISGMCNPNKVIDFLNFTGARGWDPTLAGVLGGGVIVTTLGFHYFHLNEMTSACTNQPLTNSIKIGRAKENLKIDQHLILGSIIFGMGWGLGGICPGPGLTTFGAEVPTSAIFIPSLLLGIILKDQLMK